MYGLNDMKDKNKNEEDNSSLTDDSLNSCSANQSCRDNLKHLLHSYRFHLLIVGLVILDCIIVVIELMIDLQIYQTESRSDTKSEGLNNSHSTAHKVAEVLHYSSIAFLCIFTVEIITKVYVFRTEFFKHKSEVFDAFIVITSLTLDLVFMNHEDVLRYIGLVIILRLWRIVRVIHGIAISVKTPIEHSYEKEKKVRERLEKELAEMHLYVNSLEIEIMGLRSLLKNNGITDSLPQTYLKIDRKV